MSKKKSIAKGLGASALAVATLASGLSFGSAAASAASAAPMAVVDPSLPAAGKSERFVIENGAADAGTYPYRSAHYATQNGSGGTTTLAMSRYLSEQLARSSAMSLTVPQPGAAQQLRYKYGTVTYCFYVNHNEVIDSTSTCVTNEAKQRWYIDSSSHIRSFSNPDLVLSYRSTAGESWPLDIRPLGTQGWVPVNATAWAGPEYQESLAAAVSFESSVDARAVVSGTTAANGSVEVRRGSTVVGTGTADANGDFKIAVLAPNKAGDDKLTVALVENGADKKTIEVTAAYGAGVSITDPANNADVSGSYDVRGSAQAGSTVTLKVGNGAARPITVNANGQWSQTVTLPKGETRIVATQKSKGANTTTSTVVVNPGQSNIAPLVIETPANGSTVDTPSKRIEFAGTAQPESRVLIKTETGRTIVDTFADADGNWSKVGDELAFGVPYRLITEYTPQGESTVTGEHRVTLKDSDPGVVQDPRIDTPAAESTVIAPDGLVDFAGVGATGTKVTIHPMRGLDRVVGTATVGKDGTWKISNGSLNPDNGDYNVHVKYTLPNGTTVEQDRHFFIQRTEGVVQDARIDTPAAESTVIAPDGLVDFAGVGATGTKVTIHPMRGLDRVVGTATVGKDGTWKISNGSLNPDNGDYNVHVKYTLPNGTTVEQDRHFFIKREASTDLPYVVGTPAEGSDVTLANYRASDNNGEATISGTGKTGGMVKVWNYESKNRIVIKGGEVLKVDENGKWSGVGELAGNMEYKLHIEYFAPGVDLDGEPTSVVTRSFNTVAPTK